MNKKIYDYIRFEYPQNIKNGDIIFDIDSNDNMSISKWTVDGIEKPSMEYLHDRAIENSELIEVKNKKEKDDKQKEDITLKNIKYDPELGKIVYHNGVDWEIVP